MLKELKGFLMKGNIIDLAVAVIIGGAFGKIVTSFVKDILMPPIGVLMGGVNFSDLKMTIKNAVDGAEAVTINYGVFIQSIIDFTIIGISIFFILKMIEKTQKKEETVTATPAVPPKQEVLLEEIRDLLKK